MLVRFGSTPLVLVIALALGACTPPEDRAEQARAAIRQGVEHGNRGAALEAVEDLQASLPDVADSLLEVAQLLVQAGDAPRASWLLEDGVNRYPERDDLRMALSRVSILLGNPSRALELATSISRDSEQHLDALLAHAQANLDLGNLEAALATLGEAEDLYPDRPEAQLVHISTLFREHRADEARTAIEVLLASLAGDTDETRALRRRLRIQLAQIQAQAGEAEQALAALEATLAQEPSDARAWQALVQILAKEQRSEEAVARLEAALAADEPSPGLLLLAAQLQASLGNTKEAKTALRRLIADSKSAAAYLPLLRLHWDQGEMEDASALLDEAIARFPDEPGLRLLLAENLLDQGRVEEARPEIRRFSSATFEDDPQVEYLEARVDLAEGDSARAAERLRDLAPRLDRATTQFWLGRALEESRDLDGARLRYGLAQQRDRAWTAPSAALLALEQRRGAWRAVVGHAQRLLRSAPQEIGGWIALVDALENLGEGEPAEQVARLSLKRFPDRTEPHVLVARALRAQGKTDEALAVLDEAPDLESTPELAAERILTLGMGGRAEEGIALAREALDTEPDSAPLHGALASLLFAAGAAEQGAQATDRALALAPGDPRPLRVRCQFRASAGLSQGARDDCTRYLEARPDDAGAHFMRGLALQQLGETQPAIAAYRRAADLDERDPRPRNNLAEVLAAEGDLDGALAAAQEAYRLDETNPYIMDTLGALYLRKGLADRALSLLEEAHTAAPEMPDAALHLALAYRERGRTSEARALLDGLLASDGGSPSLKAQAEEALHSLPQ